MKTCNQNMKMNCLQLLKIFIAAFTITSCSPKHDIVIRNITIIDVISGTAKDSMYVAISRGKITNLGKTAIKGKTEIDGSGKFLIPGLWDMHTHVTMAGKDVLSIYLKSGVTSLRDMGGNLKLLKSYLNTGVPSPSIYYSGPTLESPSFIKHVLRIDTLLMKDQLEPFGPAWLHQINPQSVGDAHEANRIIENLKLNGVSFIKYRNLENKDMFYAIATKARELKIPFGGHFPDHGITLEEASDAGQKSFEHMYALSSFIGDYDSIRYLNLTQILINNNSYIVPTITTEVYRTTPDELLSEKYDSLRKGISILQRYTTDTLLIGFNLDWKLRILETKDFGKVDWTAYYQKNISVAKKLKNSGVKFLTGTDQGAFMVLPGISLHEELENFVVQLGCSPAEALRCATYYPAEFFGLQNEVGSIEVGRAADLVLLSGNPLVNIRNTRLIVSVMKGGKIVGE